MSHTEAGPKATPTNSAAGVAPGSLTVPSRPRSEPGTVTVRCRSN